ncbi:MAG: methylenetetrahydrofolate reductase [NAD(P)H] [Paracoccaceae bacterium]
MPFPRVSFEFFPPQNLEASFRLFECVQALAPMGPEFVSVTYGAGGTNRHLTQEAVAAIRRNSGLTVAAHLTCVGASRAETLEIAEAYAAQGLRDIVALRGDAPRGAERFTAHPDGFASSVEMVEALARMGQFNIRVGAYPEGHPDGADLMANARWLKAKLDAGATSAVTQFFFDPEAFFRFRDTCARIGITAPIIPGILPVQNWEAVRRLAARCGAKIPARLDEGFATATRDGRQELLALAQCTALCDRLIAGGVEDLHFYTLNRAGLTREVLRALGRAPEVLLEEVA